jgi:hypothetical protein
MPKSSGIGVLLCAMIVAIIFSKEESVHEKRKHHNGKDITYPY